jgi:RNA polymerase sigma factor (sigma-70 family)
MGVAMGESARIQAAVAAVPGSLLRAGREPVGRPGGGDAVIGRGSFSLAVDELVLARAKRGEAPAIEALYRSFSTPVYTLARRLCGSAHDAEDVVQETFLEVLRSIGRFRGEGSFAGWVRKVAASKALMRLRRNRALPELESLDDALPFAADEDDAGHPVTHGQQVGDRLDLEAAFTRLSPAARAVVWLHDVEGYTHEEIAALLGKTPSFSKSQLSRAYVRLRAALAHTAGGQSCT